MVGVIECFRPIPTSDTPIPPIITGAAMPIFIFMFIPIMPWFTGIPPIPMVPVVIEGGIFAANEAGMPVAIDAGMPMVMALPAVIGLAADLMLVTWGGELRLSPPKFWAKRLTGGTPAQTQVNREFTIWIMYPNNTCWPFLSHNYIAYSALLYIKIFLHGLKALNHLGMLLIQISTLKQVKYS